MWRDCWAGAAGPRRYRPPSSVIHPDPASFANSIIINQHIGPHMPPNVHFHLPNNSIEIVAIAYSIIGTFNHLRAILNLEIQSFPGGFWVSCDYLEEESQLREE